MIRTSFALTLFFASVSTSTAAEPAPVAAAPVGPVILAAPPDLSGHWSGYWISDKNGHKGPLNAHFQKVGENCYRVRFTGRFWKVIPFIYGANLAVVGSSGDSVSLSGQTPLGPVMGTFSYDAVATFTNFEAKFTAKNDCGRFVLCRSCR